MLYDLSYTIIVPNSDLSETFLYIKNNAIIDISLQYNTLILCISNAAHSMMNDIYNYIKTNSYDNIGLNIDISAIIIEPTISFINGSLISQFSENERLDNTKTHFECISGDCIQMILQYTIYSSQQIIITNKFNNSDTAPILNTPNIKFIRPIQKEYGPFTNIPVVRVLLTLAVV